VRASAVEAVADGAAPELVAALVELRTRAIRDPSYVEVVPPGRTYPRWNSGGSALPTCEHRLRDLERDLAQLASSLNDGVSQWGTLNAEQAREALAAIAGATLDDLVAGRVSPRFASVSSVEWRIVAIERSAQRLQESVREASELLGFDVPMPHPTGHAYFGKEAFYGRLADGASQGSYEAAANWIKRKTPPPKQRAGFDTFGTHADVDTSRAAVVPESLDPQRKIGSEILGDFERKPEAPEGTGTPRDIDTKRLPPEKERQAARGRSDMRRRIYDEQEKLWKAWTKDSRVATITDADYATVKAFLAMVGSERLKSVGLLIVPEIPSWRGTILGQYNFASDVVTISHAATSSGRFTDTTIHELWHALSRYIGNDRVDGLYKEFIREREAYKAAHPAEFDLRGNLKEIHHTPTHSGYRYSSIDEWVVEKMKDLSISDATRKAQADLVRRGMLRTTEGGQPPPPVVETLRGLRDLVTSHVGHMVSRWSNDQVFKTYDEFMTGTITEMARRDTLGHEVERLGLATQEVQQTLRDRARAFVESLMDRLRGTTKPDMQLDQEAASYVGDVIKTSPSRQALEERAGLEQLRRVLEQQVAVDEGGRATEQSLRLPSATLAGVPPTSGEPGVTRVPYGRSRTLGTTSTSELLATSDDAESGMLSHALRRVVLMLGDNERRAMQLFPPHLQQVLLAGNRKVSAAVNDMQVILSEADFGKVVDYIDGKQVELRGAGVAPSSGRRAVRVGLRPGEAASSSPIEDLRFAINTWIETQPPAVQAGLRAFAEGESINSPQVGNALVDALSRRSNRAPDVITALVYSTLPPGDNVPAFERAAAGHLVVEDLHRYPSVWAPMRAILRDSLTPPADGSSRQLLHDLANLEAKGKHARPSRRSIRVGRAATVIAGYSGAAHAFDLWRDMGIGIDPALALAATTLARGGSLNTLPPDVLKRVAALAVEAGAPDARALAERVLQRTGTAKGAAHWKSPVGVDPASVEYAPHVKKARAEAEAAAEALTGVARREAIQASVAAASEGETFFPEAAVRMIDAALDRAIDEAGILKEHGKLGKGEIAADMALDGLRALKAAVTKGVFFPRNAMITMDQFDAARQTAIGYGYRQAARNAVRQSLPSLVALAPGGGIALRTSAGQRVLAAAQNVGDASAKGIGYLLGIDNGEVVVLRAPTKEGATKLQVAASAARDFLGVEDIINGTDAVFAIGDSVARGSDLQQIAVETGVIQKFASMGTERTFSGGRRLKGLELSPREAHLLGDDVARQWDDFVEDLHAVVEQPAGWASDKVKGWVAGTQGIVEDMSVRSRVGLWLGLIEEGYDPRIAGQIVNKILFDYATSVTAAERNNLFLGILFPFWAYQKNMNRFALDMAALPETAYRWHALRTLEQDGGQLLTEVIYDMTHDAYGVDESRLDERDRAAYAVLRSRLELGWGPIAELAPDTRQALETILGGHGPIEEWPPELRYAIENGYGSPSRMPNDLRQAVGLLFRGPDGRLTSRDGDQLILSGMAQVHVRRPPAMTGEAVDEYPVRGGRKSFYRDRPGVDVLSAVKADTRAYLSQMSAADRYLFMLPPNGVDDAVKMMALVPMALALIPLTLQEALVDEDGSFSDMNVETKRSLLLRAVSESISPSRALGWSDVGHIITGSEDIGSWRSVSPLTGMVMEKLGLPVSISMEERDSEGNLKKERKYSLPPGAMSLVYQGIGGTSLVSSADALYAATKWALDEPSGTAMEQAEGADVAFFIAIAKMLGVSVDEYSPEQTAGRLARDTKPPPAGR